MSTTTTTTTTTEKSFLRFALQPQRLQQRTKRWDVIGSDDAKLGEVFWYPSWRRYTYTPIRQQVLDAQCLKELADWLNRRTHERQVERKQEREAEAQAAKA